MNTTLEKTANYFRCYGQCYENALKREECDIKLKNQDGSAKGATKGERVMGNVVVRTNYGVHTFNVYFASLTSSGEKNKQWKMACDMAEWNPVINGNGEPATIVNIEGAVEPNEYVSDDGEYHYSLRWRVRRGNTRVPEEADYGLTLTGSWYVDSIAPEIRNEEETGRLLMKLYAANGQGQCFPIDTIVTDDIAEEVADTFKNGDTAEMDFDVITRHVGGENTKRKLGNRGKVDVNNGFDVTEIILAGADDPIEKPDELYVEDDEGNEVKVKTKWIDPKAMKLAIKERENHIEELKANGSTVKKKPASIKERKAAMKAASKIPDNASFDDDDELPF